MRLMPVLVFLSLGLMVLTVYQAVRQEFTLRSLRALSAETSAMVKIKEEGIIQVKTKIQEASDELKPLNEKKDKWTKEKAEAMNAAKEADTTLQTCNAEKAEAEKKTSGLTEAIQKLRVEHEDAKKKAEAEILGLKQQIQDRDKAICAFVDPGLEEGRKLCGITGAAA